MLGPLPSSDQVAAIHQPEIPSSITEQVLDPLSLALLGSQVPSFQEAKGCLSYRDELETKPVPLSQRSWGLVSQSLGVCVGGRRTAFLGGVSSPHLICCLGCVNRTQRLPREPAVPATCRHTLQQGGPRGEFSTGTLATCSFQRWCMLPMRKSKQGEYHDSKEPL